MIVKFLLDKADSRTTARDHSHAAASIPAATPTDHTVSPRHPALPGPDELDAPRPLR